MQLLYKIVLCYFRKIMVYLEVKEKNVFKSNYSV
jgi:hypothetical protein